MNEPSITERDLKPENAAVTDRDIKPAKSRPPYKPTHYKVICISMYNRDIEELDQKVAELQRRGLTRMSRSRLIRIALAELDLDNVYNLVTGVP